MTRRRLKRTCLISILRKEEGRDLMVPFAAGWRGTEVVVRAVLERTAVVCPLGSDGSPDERVLARLSEVLVDAATLRWQARGEERRFGHDGIVSFPSRRRCPRCHRWEGEVEFRAYRTSYCVECVQEVAREHDRRRRAGQRRAAWGERNREAA